MLIVKGLAVARALGDPEEDVVYTSIIDNNLQIVLDVVSYLYGLASTVPFSLFPSKSAYGVDVQLGHIPKDAFNPFRLTFANETDFWRFCGAFGEAKVTHICRAEKLLKAYEEAVDSVIKQLKAEFATA